MLKTSFTFLYQAVWQKVPTEKIWKELQPKNGKFEILGLLLKLDCLYQRYIGDISPTPVSPISYRHSNIQCGDHKKCFFLQNTKKHKLVQNYFHKNTAECTFHQYNNPIIYLTGVFFLQVSRAVLPVNFWSYVDIFPGSKTATLGWEVSWCLMMTSSNMK